MDDLRQELKIAFQYLLALAKNPVQQIQSLPNLKWKTLVTFQFCLSFASVVLANLLAPYAISVVNIFISLTAAILATGLVTLFFFYFFQILYNRSLEFRKVFTLVLFAHLPFAIFHLASYFFPPADLIGIALSGLLMIIGLVENFSIPKIIAIRLMAGLYSIFLIYWILNLALNPYRKMETAPQDLDLIEQEINRSLEK